MSLDKLIVNKPLRTKVGDYIDKAIDESRKEAEALGSSGTPTQGTSTPDIEVRCAAPLGLRSD